MKKKVKAVLFDMDGVLIDAKEWHYETLNQALALFGMNISREAHLNRFDGLPTKKKLQMMSSEMYLPNGLHSLINALKQSYTMGAITLYCYPSFQHEYLLSRLQQDGYLIAVCSNSIRQTIEYMMKRAALDKYLDLIMSNMDVSRPKPDPEIYQTAMKKLGVLPQECVIVEDNFNGIQAALASGGHLLKVDTVAEVNYESVSSKINEIEGC